MKKSSVSSRSWEMLRTVQDACCVEQMLAPKSVFDAIDLVFELVSVWNIQSALQQVNDPVAEDVGQLHKKLDNKKRDLNVSGSLKQVMKTLVAEFYAEDQSNQHPIRQAKQPAGGVWRKMCVAVEVAHVKKRRRLKTNLAEAYQNKSMDRVRANMPKTRRPKLERVK